MSVSVNPDSRTTTWNPGQIGASCCGYIGMYYSFIISRHHPILITVSSIIVIIDFQIYVILLYLFCFKHFHITNQLFNTQIALKTHPLKNSYTVNKPCSF